MAVSGEGPRVRLEAPPDEGEFLARHEVLHVLVMAIDGDDGVELTKPAVATSRKWPAASSI
jgi:hypothetical protein